MAFHALWNAGASAGLFFFVIYALIMLPALAVLLAIVAVSLKFEGRVIQAQLAPEAATGLLTAARREPALGARPPARVGERLSPGGAGGVAHAARLPPRRERTGVPAKARPHRRHRSGRGARGGVSCAAWCRSIRAGGRAALHALWNAGASAGLFFFVIYALIMLPSLAVLLAIVAVSLKFEGRVIQAQLAPEAATGLLPGEEYARLCSVRGRMHASASAFRHGGLAAWRERHAFQRAASELAFLRRRAAVDGVEPDRALERQYLRDLGADDPGA